MGLRIKTQTNYYVTEVTFEPPVDLKEVQEVLRASRSTGEVIGMYNNGGVLGISVKQRSKIPSDLDKKIREILGIDTMMI